MSNKNTFSLQSGNFILGIQKEDYSKLTKTDLITITKAHLEQQDHLVDTSFLQEESLIRFMTALGYHYLPPFRGIFFKNSRCISLGTAVFLHNNLFDSLMVLKNIPVLDFKSFLCTDVDIIPSYSEMIQAQDARLVERISLQYHKKKKAIIAYKPQVKFTL